MDDIVSRVEALAVDGQVSCARLHALAAKLGVTPLEVGRAVDERTDLRIYRCQLGVFGFGPKAQGLHCIARPTEHVPEEIAEAVRARAADGRIPCRDAWDIAERFEYPYLAMGNILEAMGIRVKPCQLGAF